MIAQVQKNIFIYKLLSGNNSYGFGDHFIRYLTFKAREPKGYFGYINGNGFTEKLEGKIIVKAWKELPQKFSNCILGDFIVKPDSFSGIVMLDKSLASDNQVKTYYKLLTYFKNRSNVLMNKLHGTHGRVFWDNNYEEISINDMDKLSEVLSYLKNQN